MLTKILNYFKGQDGEVPDDSAVQQEGNTVLDAIASAGDRLLNNLATLGVFDTFMKLAVNNGFSGIAEALKDRGAAYDMDNSGHIDNEGAVLKAIDNQDADMVYAFVKDGNVEVTGDMLSRAADRIARASTEEELNTAIATMSDLVDAAKPEALNEVVGGTKGVREFDEDGNAIISHQVDGSTAIEKLSGIVPKDFDDNIIIGDDGVQVHDSEIKIAGLVDSMISRGAEVSLEAVDKAAYLGNRELVETFLENSVIEKAGYTGEYAERLTESYRQEVEFVNDDAMIPELPEPAQMRQQFMLEQLSQNRHDHNFGIETRIAKEHGQEQKNWGERVRQGSITIER